MKKINIAIADDHLIFRQGIASLLENASEFEIVLNVAGGKELLGCLSPMRERPHVLLLDVSMPGINGFRIQEILNVKYREIKTIALSAYENEHTIIRMYRLGAMGYLHKGCGFREIRKAIHTVVNGCYYFDNSTRKLIHRIQFGFKYPKITRRELEFLQYCCTEMKYKEIAAIMNVSQRTVEGYRQSLCSKLDIESRSGLVIFALSTGLVTRNINH